MFKAQDLEGIGSGAWGFKVFGLWRCSDIDSGAWGLRRDRFRGSTTYLYKCKLLDRKLATCSSLVWTLSDNLILRVHVPK